METERFLSTGTTGRRVSFNEAALFDHSKKTQEKGRRSAAHSLVPPTLDTQSAPIHSRLQLSLLIYLCVLQLHLGLSDAWAVDE